jgi:hypothetical protein
LLLILFHKAKYHDKTLSSRANLCRSGRSFESLHRALRAAGSSIDGFRFEIGEFPAPDPYGEIFKTPGAKGFAAAGFVARLPVAMSTIGIVAMLSRTHGEYWLAGAVAATFGLTNAPQVSRLGMALDGRLRIVNPFRATG